MLSETTPQYVGINEMARILSVSIASLRKWEKDGILTPMRLPNGDRRYDIEATKKQLFNRT